MRRVRAAALALLLQFLSFRIEYRVVVAVGNLQRAFLAVEDHSGIRFRLPRDARAEIPRRAAVAEIIGERTGVGRLLIVAKMIAAPLVAHLDDAAGSFRRGDHGLRLERIVAARFLDVDVLAGLAPLDGHDRMPIVRRRDRDHIDSLVLEQPAIVAHARRGEFRPLRRDEFPALGQARRVDIANKTPVDVLYAQMAVDMGPAALQPDHRDDNPVVRADHAPRRRRLILPVDRRLQQRGAGRHGGCRGGLFQKVPAPGGRSLRRAGGSVHRVFLTLIRARSWPADLALFGAKNKTAPRGGIVCPRRTVHA